MPLAPDIAARREEILRLAARHGAGNVRVFGSAARGELTPERDVDFLVELDSDRSLFDLGGLHEYIRGRVIREARPL